MPISRREWILASACWADLLTSRAIRSGPRPAFFNSDERVELQALTNLILPETDTPGAEQAGTGDFIEAALAGYDQDQRSLYREGLADIAARTSQMFPTKSKFSSLTEIQQIALLKAIETTMFFEKLRTHTVLAYFGNPEFGWKLLGRDPAMHFDPPFGFYDDAAGKAE
jgi:Gluconate 2-dehydrogenase subunit 3